MSGEERRISIEGIVKSVLKNRKRGFISLVIDDGSKKVVEFPFRENGLSVIPLQLVLPGKRIMYVCNLTYGGFFKNKPHSVYSLFLLDGPLEGQIYREKISGRSELFG